MSLRASFFSSISHSALLPISLQISQSLALSGTIPKAAYKNGVSIRATCSRAATAEWLYSACRLVADRVAHTAQSEGKHQREDAEEQRVGSEQPDDRDRACAGLRNQ